MSRLRGFNITIPPYLAGYYTAIDDGLEEIGCPGHVSLGRRESTALRLPCDVVNEQHERMMLLVNGFEANNIGIAPFIAGFLSATLDGNKALGCSPFTGPASEAGAARVANSSNSTDSS